MINDLIYEKKKNTLITTKDFPKLAGKTIEIVGYLITTKSTSTKLGEMMYLGTFQDINGDWLDTAHFPASAKQYRLKGRGCYLMKGRVHESFKAYSLIVEEMVCLRLGVV